VNDREERERRILEDLSRYSETVAWVVRRGRDEYFGNDLRNRATVDHYLELIGEAVGAPGRPFRRANPSIPWDDLRRFRFDSAHPYDARSKPVNYEEVWRFASSDLPSIARKFRVVKFPKEPDDVISEG
jgi:uncharacterized protein with HEPN domain